MMTTSLGTPTETKTVGTAEVNIYEEAGQYSVSISDNNQFLIGTGLDKASVDKVAKQFGYNY